MIDEGTSGCLSLLRKIFLSLQESQLFVVFEIANLFLDILFENVCSCQLRGSNCILKLRLSISKVKKFFGS